MKKKYIMTTVLLITFLLVGSNVSAKKTPEELVNFLQSKVIGRGFMNMMFDERFTDQGLEQGIHFETDGSKVFMWFWRMLSPDSTHYIYMTSYYIKDIFEINRDSIHYDSANNVFPPKYYFDDLGVVFLETQFKRPLIECKVSESDSRENIFENSDSTVEKKNSFFIFTRNIDTAKQVAEAFKQLLELRPSDVIAHFF